LGITCPLTDLEDDLRKWGGQGISGTSFVGRCLDSILFYEVEDWILMCCYIGFALVVAATFWLAPPRRRQPLVR
jgi:hypothetical protein